MLASAVIPAKAGIQNLRHFCFRIPAFAGMTIVFLSLSGASQAQTTLPMKRLLDMGFEIKAMAYGDGLLRFALQKETVAYLCHGTERCERIN